MKLVRYWIAFTMLGAICAAGEDQNQIIKLIDGSVITGRVVSVRPATIKVEIPVGVVDYDVTELSMETILSLPPSISKPYQLLVDAANQLEQSQSALDIASAYIKAIPKTPSVSTPVLEFETPKSGFRVVSQNVRTVPEGKGSGYTYVAWKAIIENLSDEPKQASVECRFLDREGFLLDRDSTGSAEVRARKTTSVTATAIVKDEVWSQIRSFEVVIK